jgi:hypothetical protein
MLLMLKLNDLLDEWLAESVTWNVVLVDPDALGDPLMSPVLLKLRPAGRVLLFPRVKV